MRIVSVKLENVKSYTLARVEFRYGTNAICGHNGAGKSTLLEVIGFVLFDHLAVTQDDFVRRGEKTATATVSVEAGDGRIYDVVRRCGSSRAYYVFDEELGQRLTDGKAETVLWLRDFLGMEANADLPTLFRDAVGVPQGLLTAAFLETPSRRKDVFNPLLRVDEYERVWSQLREPGRWLELRITEQEKIIAGLRGQVAALPEALQRADRLSIEIEEVEGQRQAQETVLNDVAARLETLDAAKARLDGLNQTVAQAEMEVESLMHRREDVTMALAEAEAARRVIDETQEGFEVYEATQRALSTLESERTERDQLRDELRTVERDLALVSQRLEDLAVKLEAVEAARMRMTELGPEVERQVALEDALDEARLQVERLEGARRSLADEAARLAQMRAQMETMESAIQEREGVEEKLVDLRTELAKVDAGREELAAQVAAEGAERARLSSDLEAVAVRLKELQATLARAETSLTDLEKRATYVREGLETRDATEQALSVARDALEGLVDEAEALAADEATHHTMLEQTKARIAALETVAVEEATCPVCGQALTPAHRGTLLDRYRADIKDNQEALQDLKEERETLEQQRHEAMSDIQALESELQNLPRLEEAEEIADRVAAQEEEVAVLRASVDEARESRARISSQLEKTEETLEDYQNMLDAKTRRQISLREEIRTQETQLDTLPRLTELEQLQARIHSQVSVMEAHKGTVASLSGTPERVENLNAQLVALGDPRREYQRAGDLAETYPDLVQTIEEAEAQQDALRANAAAMDKDLEVYGDLDARLEHEREILRQHEEDHRHYVAHLREAEALDSHRETFRRVKAELSDAKQAFEMAHKDREDARIAYDDEAHAEVRDRQVTIREHLAALRERLQQRRDRLSEMEADIAHLQMLASELEDADDERDTLKELQALLGYLRGVLREAGPVITRRLVDIISLRADRLYREIMQDYAARLRWTEDYDIILKQSGRERTFQQLSGGEQMAAALAVRLALLQEVSTVDVAFFDEPTANLDEQRRDNLAESILGIKGFNQLFVISHDDTFEQDTDHVIRVRKVDGVSKVEV